MVSPSWLEVVQTVGSVATPILVLALTALGWKARTSIERRIELENKLRDDRIEIYNQILEPFIILLMSDVAWKTDSKNRNRDKNEIATSKMLSLDYKRLAFKLSLMAPDSLVRAYNDLMQYFYNLEESEANAPNQDRVTDMLTLLGTFLLEIRRSMGNEATQLDHWEMCEWWMSDARKLRKQKSAL